MLSGLTSRVGTLIGSSTSKLSGSNKDPTSGNETTTTTEASSSSSQQEMATNPADTTTDTPSAAPNQTGTGSGVLGSVRSQLPSWLGGGGKATAKETVEPEVVLPSAAPRTEKKKSKIREGREGTNTGTGVDSDDDDGSSATGGADDEQQLSDDGGLDDLTGSKAGLEKVKDLGNSIYSTLLGVGQKIKETTILGDFQREHEVFLRGKFGLGGGSSAAEIPPWIGHPQEDELKIEILSLSTDRRHFVRSPPQGVDFNWDWDSMAPVARALLKEDPNLPTMRYTLVPKVITEENFWRNYFYRVTLLKESMNSSTGGTGSNLADGTSTGTTRLLNDAELEEELNEELKSFEVVDKSDGSKLRTGHHDDDELDALLDLK